MKRITTTVCLCLSMLVGYAQHTVRMNLAKTLELAKESSLAAFRYKNMYLSGYWEYRTYKANRLPSLTLELMPARYYRYITQRYDSGNDTDVYRQQQMFSAGGGLSIRQNFDWLGGTFYIDSNLEYMRNFGETKSTQFSSIPLRIGYSQNLIGYNAFRWERKIEPLKFERAKKEFIYNTEVLSEEAVRHFFNLAMAQADHRLAKENMISTDTLYKIGLERQKIAVISQADLLTLQLDRVNAQNTLENAQMALKRARFALALFLNMDKDTEIEIDLPGRPHDISIPLEVALDMAKRNNPQYLHQRQNILEAERYVNKTRVESRMNASVNASIGFNQVAETFKGAYSNPLQQELVSVSISIPLVDWGVNKGKFNMAINNLNVAKITARQEEINLEEEVSMTVNDFTIQQHLIASAAEALELAEIAYDQTKKRFIIGKADVNSLTLSLARQQEAHKNYISALQNYWLNYYKIRQLTLHDFATGISLADRFDFDNGKYR